MGYLRDRQDVSKARKEELRPYLNPDANARPIRDGTYIIQLSTCCSIRVQYNYKETNDFVLYSRAYFFKIFFFRRMELSDGGGAERQSKFFL